MHTVANIRRLPLHHPFLFRFLFAFSPFDCIYRYLRDAKGYIEAPTLILTPCLIYIGVDWWKNPFLLKRKMSSLSSVMEHRCECLYIEDGFRKETVISSTFDTIILHFIDNLLSMWVESLSQQIRARLLNMMLI